MHQDKYSNPYFYKVLPGVWDAQEKMKELTKEEKLKRVQNYIEKFNIEHDEKYIYLYKAVNIDGTNIHNSDNKITFEVGKVYTEKCDQDINKDCSYGLHAGTYEIALDFGKGNRRGGYLYTSSSISFDELSTALSRVTHSVPYISDYYNKPSKNKPVNPNNLYKDLNFRILKVKIYKEHVVVPKNTDGKIRCNQMEIIEEVKLEPKLTFTLIKIEEDYDFYRLTYEVLNKLNNQRLTVEITSETSCPTQQDICRKLKNRITEMQHTYDMFEELSKMDGSELI